MVITYQLCDSCCVTLCPQKAKTYRTVLDAALFDRNEQSPLNDGFSVLRDVNIPVPVTGRKEKGAKKRNKMKMQKRAISWK